MSVKSGRELEVVLLVRSADPVSTIRRIADLPSVRGYFLRAGPSKRIHDVYFDTPEGTLGNKKMNLRIRDEGGSYWITWKRSLGLLGWRRKERRELELPWSRESFFRIISGLARSKVILQQPKHFDLSHPVEAMKSTGLRVLQDRESSRLVRNIVRPSEGRSEILAELAIDSVVYHFESQDVELHELEVAAKTRKGRRILEDVKDGLLDLFGGELHPWRWGKLVTGKMIRKMLEGGVLQGLLDGSRLTPEAVERVRKALESREF